MFLKNEIVVFYLLYALSFDRSLWGYIFSCQTLKNDDLFFFNEIQFLLGVWYYLNCKKVSKRKGVKFVIIDREIVFHQK